MTTTTGLTQSRKGAKDGKLLKLKVSFFVLGVFAALRETCRCRFVLCVK
jgi:hypothetical protein